VSDHPTRHLRDSAEICPEHIRIPGEGPLRCELDAGHDGKHKHFCTWWGTPASARPVCLIRLRGLTADSPHPEGTP